jgi:methionyl-tRNA formyltransferase
MWNGEPATGISIFRLVDELDAGPVYYTRSIDFAEDETASDALTRLATDTTTDLIGTIRLITLDAITANEQMGEPSYAPKLTREDGRIDWSLDAATVIQRIRAATREPGAHTTCNGESIAVLRVASEVGPPFPTGEVFVNEGHVFTGTADASVELLDVRPAGKTEMSAMAWARGQRDRLVFE